jgi:hypothetical protein
MARKSFLEIMRWYCEEKIVFLSTNRQARYYIKSVDLDGCQVQRLDASESERVTVSGYESKIAWLRKERGRAERNQLEGTVARQMCYLQSAELGLADQRKTVVLIDELVAASQNLVGLINEVQSHQAYKPMILAIVIQAIDEGELTENRVSFDWLLPRFVAKFGKLGQDVRDQQLAQGFGRLASDYFWLLAHKEATEPLAIEDPTPSQIRQRVTHAAFKEPFWQALQDSRVRADVLAAIKSKWNIDMNNLSSPAASVQLSSSLERLILDIQQDGFTFEPWQVATYVTALRTKPFVILAGVSGTGKSKLPSLVAKHTGGTSTRLSVRPDWTDSSEVLGYVDLQGKFRPGSFLTVARRASLEAETHFTCIIDEMNLARVEYYFAEILSSIEDRRPAVAGAFESDSLLSLQLSQDDEHWRQQTIPANLGIVGTVNMDESTHGFSRKVLDRAFTIELSEIDLNWQPSHSNGNANPVKAEVHWPVNFWHCRATQLSQLPAMDGQSQSIIQSSIDLLKRINDCLTYSQLQVGYRTRDEIVLFLLNAVEVRSSFRTHDNVEVDPLDLALSMKILPRIAGGSNAIRRTLLGLLGITIQLQPFENEDLADSQVSKWDKAGRPATLVGAKLPRSAARLCLMWDRLGTEGFTSYWL